MVTLSTLDVCSASSVLTLGSTARIMLRTQENSRNCILRESPVKQVGNKELQCSGFGKRKDRAWEYGSPSGQKERKIKQQEPFLADYGLWCDLNCHVCILVADTPGQDKSVWSKASSASCCLFGA